MFSRIGKVFALVSTVATIALSAASVKAEITSSFSAKMDATGAVTDVSSNVTIGDVVGGGAATTTEGTFANGVGSIYVPKRVDASGGSSAITFDASTTPGGANYTTKEVNKANQSMQTPPNNNGQQVINDANQF